MGRKLSPFLAMQPGQPSATPLAETLGNGIESIPQSNSIEDNLTTWGTL